MIKPHPLLFMPTLNLLKTAPLYHERLTTMFLKSHQGRGHLIMPAASTTDPVAASYAVIKPTLGHPLHLFLSEAVPKSLKASMIDVVVPCFRGVQDPAWIRLNRVYQKGPVRRIILTRQGLDHPLEAIDRTIDTLSTTLQTKIFLDVNSFGWDAVAHFVSRYSDLQVEGIEDAQLWRLLQLAEVLNRPVHLDDLRGKPILIEPLPHYKIVEPPPMNVHRIPFPVQYR